MNHFLIALSFLLLSCEYFQPKKEVSEPIAARVGEMTLSISTLNRLTPPHLSPVDSTTFVNKFVTDWIKKQLLILRAEKEINFNEAEIQDKVLNYQYALMVHELEKKYINESIDKEVSQEEIEAYYRDKSENFILRQNLAKCIYFKIKRNAPQIWRFRNALKKYPSDTAVVWNYSKEYATKIFLEESVWVEFDEVIQETPLKSISDKTRFLKTNEFVEVSDENFIHFVKIFSYKLIGEVAPLEFIMEDVENVIINKRKIALKKELEKKIYEEAKRSNAFEIIVN